MSGRPAPPHRKCGGSHSGQQRLIAPPLMECAERCNSHLARHPRHDQIARDLRPDNRASVAATAAAAARRRQRRRQRRRRWRRRGTAAMAAAAVAAVMAVGGSGGGKVAARRRQRRRWRRWRGDASGAGTSRCPSPVPTSRRRETADIQRSGANRAAKPNAPASVWRRWSRPPPGYRCRPCAPGPPTFVTRMLVEPEPLPIRDAS